MRRLLILLAAILTAVCVAAPASAHPRKHAHHAKTHRVVCRSGYRAEHVRIKRRVRVKTRKHHHVRYVWRTRHERVWRCEKIVRVGIPKTIPTPTPTPAPQPPVTTTPTPTPTVAPPAVHAAIDPTYTQDASNNLTVTWTYSAAASATALPTGTLALSVSQPNAVASSGGCSINVDATTTGGTCTLTLPSYGKWNVTVAYVGASTTVAPATTTDTETIEPLPTTINYKWGTDQGTKPTVNATVIGSNADLTITDANYEGATSLPVSDNLGDGCTATVSNSTATCTMPIAGTPTTFTIAYPGGTSITTQQNVSDNGVQQVTYAWPSENVAVSDPSVTVQQAVVDECGGYQQGGPLWYPTNSTVGCGTNPPAGQVPGQWPNPVTVATGRRVEFSAAAVGSLSADPWPAGYLTFTLTGPAAPSEAYDQDYGAPNASEDCLHVTNYGGGATGACQYTFSTAGTYTLRVSFTSQDANYGDSAQAYTETVDVTG